ncbi:uncharacterized protein LOC132210071 isoform X2 [Stegostoma tigrinum]|nr:uncharacterized protein LOC132210071 isoform X2 [Stegostoma tigrinum]
MVEEQKKARQLLNHWKDADVTGTSKVNNNNLQEAGGENDAIFPEGKDHTVILRMEPDQIVTDASDSIYNKQKIHAGEYRTLLKWNGQEFIFLKSTFQGNAPEVTSRSKLVVVGHGSSQENTLGGMTAHQLSKTILTLRGAESPLAFPSKSVQSLSLVACNVGAGPEGEQFVRDLLIDLRDHELEVGSLSARTAKVSVLPDGTKVTSDPGEDWLRHETSHRRQVRLGEDNQLEDLSDEDSYWTHTYDPDEDIHPLVDQPGHLIWHIDGEEYLVPDTKLDDIVQSKTKQIFDMAEGVTVEEVEKTRISDQKQETVRVRVFETFQQYLANVLDLIRESQVARYRLLRSEYNIKNIRTAWQKQQLPSPDNILDENDMPVIRDEKKLIEIWDMIAIINRMRRRTKDQETLNKVYESVVNGMKKENRFIQFGEYTLKINLENFYVEPYILPNGEAPPREIDLTYNRLLRSMNAAAYFQQNAKAWVTGEPNMISNNVNEHDAVIVVATHLAEVVRNPRMVLMNSLLCGQSRNARQFIASDPMARGGTWGTNHANIGLQSEQTDEVRDLSRAVLKKWMTSASFGFSMTQNSENLPPEADQNHFDHYINSEVFNNLPEIPTMQTYSYQSLSRDIVDHMRRLEDSVLGKSLRPRVALKMANDIQYLEREVTQSVKSQEEVDRVEYEVVHGSARLEKGSLTVKIQSKSGPSISKELQVPTKVEKLTSEELLDEHFRGLGQVSEGGSHAMERVNYALGVYGTLMGFQGAREFLEQGRDVEGGIMLAQGIHGLGELAGINGEVSSLLERSAHRALTSIATQMEGKAAQSLLGKMSKLGKVTEAPVLSTAFAAFNIYEDVERKSPLGYADAALDGAILLTGLAGPEMAPVTLALTIIRLGLDPLYSEIKSSLESLPARASTGQRCLAVLKGIALALRDIGQSILDVAAEFSPWSLAYRIPQLDERHRKDMKFIEELKSAESYFTITGDTQADGCHGVVDFLSGQDSAFGGALDVELDDANCMTVQIPNPIGSGTVEKVHCFPAHCSVNDVVAGIGETHWIHLIEKSVTLLFFIHVHTREVIGSLTEDRSTLHGSYTGNSQPNRFYTVQELPKEAKLTYSLSDYYYNLRGRGGQDAFYLGPQRSSVQGGNGQDLYFIPEWGGVTDIDNHAADGVTDWLFFNVSFAQISARKSQQDLRLFFSNQHQVRVMNWFLGNEYRHMKFRSNDYITFTIGDATLNGWIQLQAVSLDFSPIEDKPETVDLSEVRWRSVISVVGTKHGDTIRGNHLGNVLRGGQGANYLEGRDGRDTYVIEADKACDTINNWSSDAESDTVHLPSHHQNLAVTLRDNGDLEIRDTVSQQEACVILQNWRGGWAWQHIVFISGDFVMFQVSNTTSPPEIQPVLIDFSSRESHVEFDLATFPGNQQIMAVVGSPHDDRLYGNERNNVLSGMGGADFLKGRGGSDTYIIDCRGTQLSPIIIDNEDTKEAMDFLLLPEDFEDLEMVSSSTDVHLRYQEQPGCYTILKDWFTGRAHRHLMLRSKDGVVFTIPDPHTIQFLPWILQHPFQVIQLIPQVYAVDKSNSKLDRVFIDARSQALAQAVKLIGSSQQNWIYGNQRNNYIDCGSGFCHAEGGNGSDTYILTKGNYTIDNYAEDLLMDQILMPATFARIRAWNRGTDIHLDSPDLSCTLSRYLFGEAHQHLVARSSDGIWFTFSERGLQPLYVDMALQGSQHLNLSSVPSLNYSVSIYGQRHLRNFIVGNSQPNTIAGGSDTDVLEGRGGDDTLQGSAGEDYLSGGQGADEIHGGEGTDWILGGAGSDILYPGLGADRVHGGSGSDTLLFAGDPEKSKGVLVNLELGFGIGADADGDLYYTVENAIGTGYADVLIGSGGDNILSGEGGNDLFLPLDGRDTLRGGDGADLYNLDGSRGLKVIDNFAKDLKYDTIALGSRHTKDNLFLERSGVHLIGRLLDIQEGDFAGAFLIRDWFMLPENRHIVVQLDKSYNMEDLISESVHPGINRRLHLILRILRGKHEESHVLRPHVRPFNLPDLDLHHPEQT